MENTEYSPEKLIQGKNNSIPYDLFSFRTDDKLYMSY